LKDESIPVADISGPSLCDKAIAVKRSEEGSLGVMFVQTEQGHVVLKSGTKVAQEVFGTRLAQKLGILVPDVRIVGYGDHQEWAKFRRIIEPVASPADRAMFDKAFTRPFWLMYLF
jgi:hypothetical protein